jgi:hypothetical protein
MAAKETTLGEVGEMLERGFKAVADDIADLRKDMATKEDVRMLKTLAREKTKTTVIARKLKRGVGATYQKAMRLGVTLGGSRARKGA